MLYFLAAGMNYDNMYLAGDPAQAVVEGVDFRFEEIRSLVHALSKGSKRVEKTVFDIKYCVHAHYPIVLNSSNLISHSITW